MSKWRALIAGGALLVAVATGLIAHTVARADVDPGPAPNPTPVLVNEYDLNGDGCVNAPDADILAAAFGSVVGDPNYDLRCDFNTDGLVDGTDYNLWRPHLGEGCGN